MSCLLALAAAAALTGSARANPSVSVKLNLGSEGPTQLEASVLYSGPGSALQRFYLGLPKGEKASSVVAGLPNGATSTSDCEPSSNATEGSGIQCVFPAGAVSAGKTVYLTLKISPPLTSSVPFIYQATDSSGTAVGTVPGPTIGTTPTPTPVTAPCTCEGIRSTIEDPRILANGNLLFRVDWELACSGGSGACKASITLEPDGDGYLKGTTGAPVKHFRIDCGEQNESCSPITTGHVWLTYELATGEPPLAGGSLSVQVYLRCQLETRDEYFHLAFDKSGHVVGGRSRTYADIGKYHF
jgi:hypothetical protein